MVHRIFSGLTLMALGTMALLQVMGLYYFGLTFWPTVLVWIGLEITWGSLFDDWHGPQMVGAALGLFVGGFGLLKILENLGLATAMSVGEMARVGWPVLVVALGLSLLFRRPRHPHRQWDCQ